jgi:hypothetical protein
MADRDVLARGDVGRYGDVLCIFSSIDARWDAMYHMHLCIFICNDQIFSKFTGIVYNHSVQQSKRYRRTLHVGFFNSVLNFLRFAISLPIVLFQLLDVVQS